MPTARGGLFAAALYRQVAAVIFCVSFFCVSLSLSLSFAMPVSQQASQANAPGSVARRIGSIKAINGNAITLTPDSGPEMSVTVQPNARILRTAPGEKDLKNATPIQLQDLQVGDRVLVGGKIAEDGSISASAVVVMKLSDVEAKNQRDLQDWQKRGVNGIVSSVDPSAGTVTIATASFPAKKDVAIHTTSATVIRRYAPDSVKFDDAKPSTLAEIHPGDQVRARGNHSADGNELGADELVSGTFRNIAGTVNSVDASSSTVTVHDLLSGKSVTMKVTHDSQLHQLPPEVAERFAMRLKRMAGGALPAATGSPTKAQTSPPASASSGTAGTENGGGRRGAPDLQQMLNRLPVVPLNDLHKGDAVVVLSTEGSAGTGSVVTLLTGVESILRAAPNASGASILTPWSLSPPAGDTGP
jgi:hypothetical protein